MDIGQRAIAPRAFVHEDFEGGAFLRGLRRRRQGEPGEGEGAEKAAAGMCGGHEVMDWMNVILSVAKNDRGIESTASADLPLPLALRRLL